MLALACGWSADQARADGDPASDVLANQQLFLPQDAAMARGQQVQLAGLLQEAAHSGYPIRLALIASPSDLGSITQLWRQPQTYAAFLGEELSLVYHGPLLVVMPNGFGHYNFPDAGKARASLAAVKPAGGVGPAALSAVRDLTAAAGHPLALPTVGAQSTAGGGGSPTPWIAFAIGALLVLAAWIVSLRARPLGRLGGESASDNVSQSLTSQG